MRIAFVTLEYPPLVFGGAGKYAEGLTSSLAKLGHNIVVFAPHFNSQYRRQPDTNTLKVVAVPVNRFLPFPAVQFWLGLNRQIREAEKNGVFDVIHFNGNCNLCSNWTLSQTPRVMTVHHLAADVAQYYNKNWIVRMKNIRSETSPIYLFIERRGIESSDKIIAVSDYTKKRILERYSAKPGKIERIYNAIRFEKTTFSDGELKKLRDELRLPNAPVVLFVGRVDDRRKGLEFLLKAFKDVSTTQETSLLIVGGGNQSEARRLVRSLRLSNSVFFAGKVEETSLRQCYALCSVYVCPSRLEGFGLTILEAFSAGKPVVATRVGAIPEIVGAKNGSLVQLWDTRAMSNAITYFLDNPEFGSMVGSHNAKEVQDRFDWNKAAVSTAEVYARAGLQS